MTVPPTKEEFDEKWNAEFDADFLPLIASGKSPSMQEIKKHVAARNNEAWDHLELKAQELGSGTAVTIKKRGRPKKEPEPAHKGAIASVTLDEVNAWKAEINAEVAHKFPTLSEHHIHELAEQLVELAGHYKYGRQLRANQESKTNKQHIEKPVLIRDCAKAWEGITGETITIWQDQSSTPNSHEIIEPPSTKLARIVAKAAMGKPLMGDLREHANKAKKIIEKERKTAS
jgi:hypothetical protein